MGLKDWMKTEPLLPDIIPCAHELTETGKDIIPFMACIHTYSKWFDLE